MQNGTGSDGRRMRPWRRAFAAAVFSVVALVALAPAASAKTPPLEGVVNVNTAGIDELALLPGVGESRARAILTLRDARGGRFEALEELLEVRGIGERSLASIRPFARLDGETTARKP